jgi:hypothetical protein
MRQPRYADIFRDDTDKAEIASRVWQDVKAHLQENDLVTALRVQIADRYARAYAEYEVLYPSAAEGPVKAGPNGGDVFRFEWSAVEKLNDRLAKFEKALLISPESAGGEVGRKVPRRGKTAKEAYLDA